MPPVKVYKLGESVGKWNARHLIVEQSRLIHFLHQSDRAPKRILDLHRCSITPIMYNKAKHCFEIHAPYISRVYVLGCDTLVDAQYWHDLVSKGIHYQYSTTTTNASTGSTLLGDSSLTKNTWVFLIPPLLSLLCWVIPYSYVLALQLVVLGTAALWCFSDSIARVGKSFNRYDTPAIASTPEESTPRCSKLESMLCDMRDPLSRGYEHCSVSTGGSIVYRYAGPSTGASPLRAVGWRVVQAPVQNVLEFVSDISTRPQYNHMCSEARAVKSLTPVSQILYQRIKGIWPMQGREFVSEGSVHALENDSFAVLLTDTMEEFPYTPGIVRASLVYGGFLIQPHAEGCKLTVAVNLDLKGSVLKAVLDKVHRDQGVSLDNIADIVTQSLHVPKLVSQDLMDQLQSGRLSSDSIAPELPLTVTGSLRPVDAWENACAKVLSEVDDDTGWIETSVISEVTLYHKDSGNPMMPLVKGVGVVYCGVWAIVKLISDVTRKGEYDPMFDSGRVLEQLSPSLSIYYQRMSRVFPTSARDFVFVGGYRLLDDGRVLSVGTSIVHASAPEVSGCVRAHLLYGGYVLQPNGPDQCLVTYVTCADLKGSLPAWVLKEAATKQPLTVHNIRAPLKAMVGQGNELAVASSTLQEVPTTPKVDYVSICNEAVATVLKMNHLDWVTDECEWNGRMAYRGQMVVEASLRNIQAVLCAVDRRSWIDTHVYSRTLVLTVDENTYVSNSVFQAQKNCTEYARGFTTVSHSRILEDGSLVCINTSVPSLHTTDILMGTAYVSSWIVTPLSNRCKVTYISQVDLNAGSSVPKKLVTVLSRQQPGIVKHLGRLFV